MFYDLYVVSSLGGTSFRYTSTQENSFLRGVLEPVECQVMSKVHRVRNTPTLNRIISTKKMYTNQHEKNNQQSNI